MFNDKKNHAEIFSAESIVVIIIEIIIKMLFLIKFSIFYAFASYTLCHNLYYFQFNPKTALHFTHCSKLLILNYILKLYCKIKHSISFKKKVLSPQTLKLTICLFLSFIVVIFCLIT